MFRNLNLLCAILAVACLLTATAGATGPKHKKKPKHTATAHRLVKTNKAWMGEDESKERQDLPDEAHKWRMLSWKDEFGNIPPDGRLKALKQREQNLSIHANVIGGAPFNPTWTSQGPTDVGGRTTALIIKPSNPNTVFAGAAGGGVWKSTDRGTTWNIVNDRWSSLAMGALAFDPTNDDVIYAGTGEVSYNADAILGGGIFKSTDNGATWAVMPSTTGFGAIGGIAIDPSNHNNILVGGRSFGVMRSTDGGATWTNSLPTLACYSVRFDPNNSSKAMASTFDGSTNRLSYSTDGGATWTNSSGTGISNFYARYEFAYAPSNSSIVYATVGGSNGSSTATVLKSTDGGHSFSQVSTQNWTSQLWYDNALLVDPTNPNTIFAGNLNIYKSTNGGSSFSNIAYWANHYSDVNLPHADHHVLVCDPGFNGTTNTTLWDANDGGIYRTDSVYTVNTGGPWLGLNNGLVTTQFYGGAFEGTSGTYLGGLQDNGTVFTTSGSTTSTLEFGGDGGWVAIDPTNPNYLYGEYVYAEIHRATDGGNNANYIYSGITDAGGSNANFISPFILSPSTNTTMWVGARHLWRSTNVTAGTPSWQNVATAPVNISAIAEAPSNPAIAMFGCNGGQVYRSTNANATTPTFTQITVPASRLVGRITYDPTNANTVYIGFGGYNATNLYKSTDGGTTWSSLVGTGVTALPAAPIHGIAVDPLNPTHIFVGTEVGLYYSGDGGGTWSTSDFGPSTACVDEVNIGANSRTLLATTHGRGLWSATLLADSDITNIEAHPSILGGGLSTTGTVTLRGPAPTGGLVVNLSSDNAVASVPSTVTVPAGSTAATFTISTVTVTTPTTANIKAKTSTSQTTLPILVNPCSLAYMVCDRTTVLGGLTANLTLQSDVPAPAGGLTVNLSSSSSAATIQASAVIPAGAKTLKVPFTTSTVLADTPVTFSGQSTGGLVRHASITVQQATIASAFLSPASIGGGTNGKLYVYLHSVAGAGGVTVNLTSTNLALAAVPSTLTVPAGSNYGVVTFPTAGVDSTSNVTIGASINGGAVVNNTLTLTPAKLYLVVVTPTQVTGGSNSNVVVYLDGKAGPSGVTVSLSADYSLVTVPATLTIPAGKNAVSGPIRTRQPIASTKTVTITVTFGGVTKVGYLTVNP